MVHHIQSVLVACGYQFTQNPGKHWPVSVKAPPEMGIAEGHNMSKTGLGNLLCGFIPERLISLEYLIIIISDKPP